MNQQENYFAILGLPVSYDVSVEQLNQALYERLRLAHPDQHAGAGEAQRQLLEQQTRNLNHAYTVLRNKPTRLQYLLQLTHPGFQSIDLHTYVPNSFLEQTMEWHDWLAQSHSIQELEARLMELESMEETCYVHCLSVRDNTPALLTSYAQIKFIQRFKQQLQRIIREHESYE
ncbi:MAG: hypothetical protein JSS50_02975 [Proteobacteria bacterium]|nr:hypothetical protein [Pseudomonadota bacterium]